MAASNAKKLQLHVYGTVPAQRGPVILAADGATDPQRASGGFLATSGHYGVRAHPYPDAISGPARVVVAELRAIWWGLEQVTKRHTGSITVLTDSRDAIGYLTRWSKGDQGLPAGYRSTWRMSGETAALEQLRELVATRPGLVFRHEKGHAGHPLNETVDSFAKLGLRCSKGIVPKDTARSLADMWARRGLDDYRTYKAAKETT